MQKEVQVNFQDYVEEEKMISRNGGQKKTY